MTIAINGFAFAPTNDQCAVNVKYTSAERNLFQVEGKNYILVLDLVNPQIIRFEMNGNNLLGEKGIRPSLNGKPLTGKGRINIYSFGTQSYEIHVRDLKAEGIKADIELALFAYSQRVFVNLNVTPRGPIPAVNLGWTGEVVSPMALPKRLADPEVLMKGEYIAGILDRASTPKETDLGEDGPRIGGVFQTAHQFSSNFEGTRSLGIVLLAGGSPQDLARLVRWELHPEMVQFDLTGGILDGYQKEKGFYQITTDYRGPRSFEEGWSNPNQRYEVALKASLQTANGVNPGTGEIICNVRNTYGVLEGAVLTDADGFPLPVQVQVCKNFAGENEEGPEEGDIPYGESYFPVNLAVNQPFSGKVYHLFGNWGTHPLKQISSIRFFHHYFHASLGPTETFCYVPFEFPREDHRNYLLADVRGLSNLLWTDQPQHDHVSVIGILRYLSGGKWINNLLQDTRIYLTAPNLASFALDYLSEDGKIKTTAEIFELPQDDESRCFMKLSHEVLEPVEIDDSVHNLRFLNAGAYIVNTIWPKVAYTQADGKTAFVDVPAEEKWVLEGVPLGKEFPFCAAYPHRNGNMAFFVNRFEGILGGKPVDSFGLSVFGGTKWTEMFLTAPGAVPRLEKGDRIETHLFVMPYGHAQSDHAPAENQRDLYGPNLPTVTVQHGEVYPGFPRRIKVGPEGYAEFTLKGGSNWIPILVEGFPSHRAPMLWENRKTQWLFHDQQIYGNDWYQSYRAQDGSIGFVFVVKVRPNQSHHYLVSLVPYANAITQQNGFVTIGFPPMTTRPDPPSNVKKGVEVAFISPVKFKGLDCQRCGVAPIVRSRMITERSPHWVPGNEIYRCVGTLDTSEPHQVRQE